MNDDLLDPNLVKKYNKTVVEIYWDSRILSYQEYFNFTGEAFYMITAANPFSNELSNDQNDALNERLKLELLNLNLEILPGIGRDSESAWFEKGWVVRGLPESDLIALAQKYEQNAIFRFDANGQHVINCRK
jgi:hypothetical protein